MSIWFWILLIIVIGIAIVIISSFINNRKIVIRKYQIEDSRITKDCCAVFLSDLHGNCFGSGNDKLIAAIKKIDPDIILVGGDLITATTNNVDGINWKNAFSLIDGIKEYPIYYAQGNHEYRMDIYRDDFGEAYDRYMNKMKEYGANILANQSCVLEENNIKITGLSIDKRFYRKFEKHHMNISDITERIGEKDESRYELILAHNPEYFKTYSKRGDLILSGHLHGGIMKLPLIGGVISPRFRLFPKYSGGRYDENGSTIIVSRGLGSHTIPLRVFNPCELCVVNMRKSN